MRKNLFAITGTFHGPKPGEYQHVDFEIEADSREEAKFFFRHGVIQMQEIPVDQCELDFRTVRRIYDTSS